MIVELENVKKHYSLGNTKIDALNGVDFRVAAGDFVSVCGPSGSGKSTLLNIIGCLDLPSSGRVRFFGNDVSTWPDKRLSRHRNLEIGYIFQSFNLIPVLNVFENIEYPLLLQNLSSNERCERVNRLIQDVGLDKFIRHRPDELSGGQRQRVAIARALVTRPKLILADEPTANLDSKTGESIMGLMANLNQVCHTAFVFSTHDPMVMGYANTTYRLKDGVLLR